MPRASIEQVLRDLEVSVGGPKSVIHSDLHLAQVLRRRVDGKLLFIDFEGEPERAQGERGRTLPPLRDVGSMVRSFAYLRHYAIRDFAASVEGRSASSELGGVRVSRQNAEDQLIAWEQETVKRFTASYVSRSTLYHTLDPAEVARQIRGWAMEKALYELDYELKHRVENFPIPLDGIVALATSSGPGPG